MASTGNANLLTLNTGILAKDACIVIVKTEWNAAIVNELENGCHRIFTEQGIQNILSLIVPGAVEIPFAIKAFWEAKKYMDERPNAFIALGCVIKGDTPHFDYVCKAVTDGVTSLNLALPVPVIFGVLTVNTDEQAQERIGGKHGHKGEEAAITALKMIALQKSFKL
ncbi:6,7-dimethyl-8-ribityllumazine synthase [Flavihumibacter profundi]|jgi:6,7-dimethyl-8-ribityllumazine synthase|uniref:6,7-dimethyl-8-ribityllumazine synthase n=1 Tax=Flavihumibacter profundi TaxID=2716883 RepID=UPI001CC81EA0|nr:6,7-dimethyl-8-ribityllumazine synthase [Flavihumibacter profundi]MBZ5856165.1 6,7-dimethyl-8-ribityllumazine synthase [Flavihumibacter profundi]